jgi:hypothetical protein
LEFQSLRALAAVAHSLTSACIKRFLTGEKIIDS